MEEESAATLGDDGREEEEEERRGDVCGLRKMAGGAMLVRWNRGGVRWWSGVWSKITKVKRKTTI